MTSSCPAPEQTAEQVAAKRARLSEQVTNDCQGAKQSTQKQQQLILPCYAINAEECFGKIVAAARSAGIYWNPKLVRRSAPPPMGVPGIITCESLIDGELLCMVPSHLLLSVASCKGAMPGVFEACEALPSSDAGRREEAAHVACLAVLLHAAIQRRRTSTSCDDPELAVPALWHRCADALLGMEFEGHPYHRVTTNFEEFSALLAPSGEVEHIRSSAEYVLTVYRCLQDHVRTDVFSSQVTAGHFFQAWLCLLTREFGTPDGSALVPVVDHFNHAAIAGATQDWDEDSAAVVVKACRAHAAGEQVFLDYGVSSNPLLFRTYGFTVRNSEESAWTCTFTAAELQDAFEALEIMPDLQEQLCALPNIDLDAGAVSDTLAMLLETCALLTGSGKVGASLLRDICTKRALRYSVDGRFEAALQRYRGRKSAGQVACWEEVFPDSNKKETQEEQDVLRVKLSEHLCLAAHLEALDTLSGFAVSEDQLLDRAAGLRADFGTLQRAGILDVQLAEPDASAASAVSAAVVVPTSA